MNVKILKFGGSSVADAKNINKVIDIILQSFPKEKNIVVVVSALGGVTDGLVELANLALEKELKYNPLLENIYKRHYQVAEELIGPKSIVSVLSEISNKFKELEKILKNISKAGKLSAIDRDAVISFGEQFSAYIISEVIRNRGVDCKFVDARDVIKTDDNFGEANVDIENSYKLIYENITKRYPLYVMGGFIASTRDGITTTLGRGGSDYTASLVGAALDASIIEIWTDVDGLMTADPRKTKQAVTIPSISYEEAEQMANEGAKVIHPKTMKPARLKGIPIYIKNTFNPEGGYTKISNDK